jgi:hypothetical protein
MDVIEFVPVILAAIVVGIRLAMYTPRTRRNKLAREA